MTLVNYFSIIMKIQIDHAIVILSQIAIFFIKEIALIIIIVQQNQRQIIWRSVTSFQMKYVTLFVYVIWMETKNGSVSIENINTNFAMSKHPCKIYISYDFQ